MRLGMSCRRSVNPFTFNCLLPVQRFITTSYADQHHFLELFSNKWSAVRSLPHALRNRHPSILSFQVRLLSLSLKGMHALPILSSSTFLFHESGRYLHKRVVRGLLHCACRTSTVSSCAFHEQEEPPNRPLHHLLPHLLPLLSHLRLPRRLAFGQLWHHHGVEAPL